MQYGNHSAVNINICFLKKYQKGALLIIFLNDDIVRFCK